MPDNYFVLITLFFLIALIYSAVGFGGGSSYLAILSLTLTSFFLIRSTALACNLVVVSSSSYLFYKNGLFNIKKFLPFIVASIPFAFLGAVFRLKEQTFFILLGLTLVLAALALAAQAFLKVKDHSIKYYPKWSTYLLGGFIGLVSGLVGIGGGIFLAPVLNYLKWDTPKTIAALASFFILVNSIAGLIGLGVSATITFSWPAILGLLAAVFIGGQLGVRLTIFKLSAFKIKILTAALVFLAGARVLFKYVNVLYT